MRFFDNRVMASTASGKGEDVREEDVTGCNWLDELAPRELQGLLLTWGLPLLVAYSGGVEMGNTR